MRDWLFLWLRRWLSPLTIRRLVEWRDHRRSGDELRAEVRALRAEVLALRYPQLRAVPAGGAESKEYRVYSQNGEDGLIAHLLSRIGPGSRTFCEIGVEDGRECNTALLALEFGWKGVMVEGDATLAKEAAQFYDAAAPGRVKIVSAFVTAENLEKLLSDAGVPEEIDLLSIDVDGVDYWLWEACVRVKPRLVVIEYNAFWGTERAVTVPYSADFNRFAKHPSGHYCGASLPALAKLGKRKGYVLAGCDAGGLNAFFVRKDLAERAGLADLEVREAFVPFSLRTREPVEVSLERIRHLPLVEV